MASLRISDLPHVQEVTLEDYLLNSLVLLGESDPGGRRNDISAFRSIAYAVIAAAQFVLGVH